MINFYYRITNWVWRQQNVISLLSPPNQLLLSKLKMTSSSWFNCRRVFGCSSRWARMAKVMLLRRHKTCEYARYISLLNNQNLSLTEAIISVISISKRFQRMRGIYGALELLEEYYGFPVSILYKYVTVVDRKGAVLTLLHGNSHFRPRQ